MEILRPNQLEKEIKERLHALKSLLDRLNKACSKAPSGRIRICQNRGKPHYYLVTDKGSFRGQYLQKSQKELAKQLAQKDYETKLIPVIEREIKLLDKYLRQTEAGHEVQKLYEKLCKARRALISPVTLLDNEYADKWKQVTWEGRPFSSDAPSYYTSKGEHVRSKSELMIAEALTRNKIPYRYEYPVKIIKKGSLGKKDSCITLHPDFLCLNIHTRQEFYWEHFGIMDNTEYANNAAGKLRLYTENGFIAGRNLIISMETQAEPLSTVTVEKLIQTYLA